MRATQFARKMANELCEYEEILKYPPSKWNEKTLFLIKSMVASKIKMTQNEWNKVMCSLRSLHHECKKASKSITNNMFSEFSEII